jgi:phage-related minor tail protein
MSLLVMESLPYKIKEATEIRKTFPKNSASSNLYNLINLNDKKVMDNISYYRCNNLFNGRV